MSNRQFHRSFIIMKALDDGYSLQNGKEPTGYGKLEIKNNNGKLHLYIQGMKPADPHQTIYDVILISGKDEVHPVKLTSIQVPDSGRGEYEITFDADNVGESGDTIGLYHALAVVDRPLGENRTLHFPLVGYSDKRVELDWTNGVSRQLKQMYGTAQAVEHPESTEQLQDAEEDRISMKEAHTISKKYQPDIEEERIDVEDQFESVEDQLCLEEDQEEMHSLEQDSSINYNIQLGSTPYWSKVEGYYNKLFDNNKKVTPFDDVIGEVDWIRVDNYNEPGYPPYLVNGSYPPYSNEGNWLDHYLLGLVRKQGKVQYVVYGIPGIYTAVPPMSMHGFSRWLPVKNGYGAGYWLLYIDAMTGNVAYPY